MILHFLDGPWDGGEVDAGQFRSEGELPANVFIDLVHRWSEEFHVHVALAKPYLLFTKNLQGTRTFYGLVGVQQMECGPVAMYSWRVGMKVAA